MLKIGSQKMNLKMYQEKVLSLKKTAKREDNIFFFGWIVVIWVCSILLQHSRYEVIVNNYYLAALADSFCTLVPPIKKYLAIFKTNPAHSRLMITIGCLGSILMLVILIRHYEYRVLVTYFSKFGRWKSLEQGLLTGVIIGAFCIWNGYYPRRLLIRYGVNPENSYFWQGVWAYMASLFFIGPIEIFSLYISRNRLERKQR